MPGILADSASRGRVHPSLRRAAAFGVLVMLLALRLGPAPAGAQTPGAVNVSLSASPTTVSAGRTVRFSLSASPPAVRDARLTSLVLDYGDGASDDIPGPFGAGERVTRTRDHAYAAAGAYTAVLTATASDGETNSDSQTITVTGGNQPPIGGIDVTLSASPADASAGESVRFSLSASPPSVLGGSIASLVIDYGDGASADIPGPFGAGERVTRTRDHAYAAAGVYTAVLTATASNGETKSDSKTISVTGGNVPPIGGLDVALSAAPADASTGESVRFGLLASPPSVQGGRITSLVLDYGDGASDAVPGPFSAGEQVERTRDHAYATAGIYTAILTAATSNGDTKSASQTISVTGGNPPPIGGLVVNLTASPGTVPVAQPVTFNVSASPPSVLGGSISSLLLDFGDGSTADLGNGAAGEQVTRTTSHAYAAPGSYTAILTATASSSQTGSATQTITVFGVTPPPSPSVSVALQPGWNLIALPNGATIPGPLGTLYTFQAGDITYQLVQDPQSGLGYWAYMPFPTTETIPLSTPPAITQVLPAGEYVMLGNPGSAVATISGADVVYVYDASTGYLQTATLQPGQGAWVLSFNGGTVTVSSP